MPDTENVPDPRPKLRRAVAQLAAVAAAVRPERLNDPTPCTEYDVRGLLGHVLGAARALTEVASSGGYRPSGPPATPQVADDGWAAALDEAGSRLVAAWDDESVLTAMYDVPWGKSPGYGVISFLVLETVVHTWDLNEAIGRPVELDPELSEHALKVAETLPPEGREGAFGAARPAPEGADVHTRLAARTGRPLG
ncbi:MULTISPECIES: TIGR03086 family metal-binding protein [Streptomyces]|uniref:TIGR03086 family metal-binding protein n=1 Tax=Streptomyces TaxID=1883 RepID=UPI00163C1686|nr:MULTISPECIES: TIGR03086 family metal-binding protein [Streptomyces]MBC2874551.1 TIGR03086 family protein [Streptomyces sp. TYQ1024]UBI36681.1 TIGR03086 family protein [Streptomyces mobaraensis]UKW29273.1 TIGR03086 family metal-binding protein [Streptomyces sp. TYQ1024]